MGLFTSIYVEWILANVWGNNRLHCQSDMANNAFTQLQMKFCKFINVVASEGFCVKNTLLFARLHRSDIRLLEKENTGCIIGNKRIKRIHD